MSIFDGVNRALGNTKSETQEIGIGTFTTHATISESTTYSNSVPVDVLESGGTATDDIINNPISVSISGVIGDVFIATDSFPQITVRNFEGVGEITALLPARSQQQIQRVSIANAQLRDAQLLEERASRLAGKARSLFDNSASTAKTEQEKFQEYMEAVHFSRLPISISTKRRQYENMALADLTITDDNTTGELVFAAKFTQIDYSQLVFSTVNQNFASPAPSVGGKTSGETDQGGQNPETNEAVSLLSTIFG